MARRKRSRQHRTTSKASAQQQPKNEERVEDPTRKKVMAGVITSLVSAAVIALCGNFIITQKNEVIQVLREELHESKKDVLGHLAKERGNRRRLVIALREAGVDLPVDLLLAQVADDSDPEIAREVARMVVDSIPVVDTADGYRLAVANIRATGAEIPLLSNLPDGSRLLGFTGDLPPGLEGHAQTTLQINFSGATAETIEAFEIMSADELLVTPGISSSHLIRLKDQS